MNREQRIRRIRAMKKIAQADQEEFDFDSIPKIPATGQFGNHEVLRTDFDLQFDTKNLDELFMQASNNEWITIPDEVRRLNVPHLFYLNPAAATSHEKYFGVKTEYGFIHTPASAALFAAAVRGSVPRKNFSEMKSLEVPQEMRGRVGGDQLFTLDSEGERRVIQEATNWLLEAHNNPDLLRQFKMDQSGEVARTTSHGQGISRTPGSQELPADVQQRLDIVERSLGKSLSEYPKLERTINTFMGTLSTRMDSLMKEQANVNRSVRFQGSQKETEDILRQNLLRILLETLKGEESPLQGTEVYEQDYRIS